MIAIGTDCLAVVAVAIVIGADIVRNNCRSARSDSTDTSVRMGTDTG